MEWFDAYSSDRLSRVNVENDLTYSSLLFLGFSDSYIFHCCMLLFILISKVQLGINYFENAGDIAGLMRLELNVAIECSFKERCSELLLENC